MEKEERDKLQKKIVKSILKDSSGRLLLSPRMGKTKIIIDIIKRDKPKGKILWVTTTTKLATEDIPMEFEKWKGKKFLKQLETTTWKSLPKVKGHYDLIIFDEEQFMTEANVKPYFEKEFSANRILSMTGTPSKTKVKLELYKRLNLSVIYELSLNSAVDIGILSNYSIKVVNIDMDTCNNIFVEYKDKKTGELKSFQTSEVKQYEYQTRRIDSNMTKFGLMHRLHGIKNSPSKLGAAKYIINSLPGKKLIFTASIAQAEELCDHVYHGKTGTEDLDLFVSGKIDKIAMVNKGGTGYTYSNIDHLILTQVDSDRNGLTTQKIS